jgi:uncharacterized membrane protein YoaK (UPF0700 family)
LIAGSVNAIGLLGFEHQSVSHLSGTATLIGVELSRVALKPVAHLTGIVFSFLLGAGIAGGLLHGFTVKLGRHYDTALFIEAAFLFVAAWMLMAGSFYGHFLASAACGLQNALATTYSGAIVRTTHVTGIFTDLGIMVGSLARGQKLDRRKATLFLLIVFGFTLGGLAGALLFARYAFIALCVPASVCLLTGLTYHIYAKRSLKAATRA